MKAWPNILDRACARQALAWVLATAVHTGVFLLAGEALIESARFAFQTEPGVTELEIAAWAEPAPAPHVARPPLAITAAPALLPSAEAAPISANEPAPSAPLVASQPGTAPPVPAAPSPATRVEAPPVARPPATAAAPVRAEAAGQVPAPTATLAVAPVAASSHARPDYERNPPPPYPRSARRQGQQGVVLLRVRVSEHGTVEALSISQSSGHALLDQAALKAIKSWRFRPARAGPLPIPSTVEVPIRFTLESTAIPR